MGQKTNPNILRLGKTKEWKSKYIEKKVSEFSPLTFRDLEIRRFIYQFFLKNELQIQSCKLYYSESSLHIYVAYNNSARNLLSANQNNNVERIKLQPKKEKSKGFIKKNLAIQRSVTKKQFYTQKLYKKNFKTQSEEKWFQSQYLLKPQTTRYSPVKNFKICVDEKSNAHFSEKTSNLFSAKILKSISLFTEKRHNIFLNLKQVNRESSLLSRVSNKDKQPIAANIAKLRRFQENEFFKKGFNILHNFAGSNTNAKFLAKFVAFYLKKIKRANFFLRFLKIALEFLVSKKFAKFKKVQIKIKGRFNGAPRSSHKFINIGKNIPVLTINSKIDYGEQVSYTSNGTFGIKVWTYAQV